MPRFMLLLVFVLVGGLLLAQMTTEDSLLVKAKAGDTKAQYEAGVYFCNQAGIQEDENSYLDELYDEGEDVSEEDYYTPESIAACYKEAADWFKLASDKNYAAAQYRLGVLYSRGNGVKRDAAEGLRLFTLAANQGNKDAQRMLGYHYCVQEGAINQAEAIKWFKLAAEQGDYDSQTNLADCYMGSDDTAADYQEAYYWYYIANSNANVDEETSAALADVSAKLSPAQISTAKAKADLWLNKRSKKQ